MGNPQFIRPSSRTSVAAILVLVLIMTSVATVPIAASAQTATFTLTINSQSLGGSTITGLWTVLTQGGATVASGFLPITFTLNSGQQYTVTISNYQGYAFDHWQDNGSTSPARSITITQNTALTALFRTPSISISPTSGTANTSVTVTGNSFAATSAVTIAYDAGQVATVPATVTTSSTGAFSATFSVPSSSTAGSHTVKASTAAGDIATSTFTDTRGAAQRVLTVKSQMTSGTSIGGFWTSLWQNGQVIASGYTPINFTLVSGQQYAVRASGFGQYFFDHWQDNGSTNSTRTVTITQNTAIVGIYRADVKTLTVNAQLTGGSALNGIVVSLSQNGQSVGSNLTPGLFTANTGAQYTISVSGTSQYTFDHWVDNSSTNPSRSLTVTQDTTLTAVFQRTFRVISVNTKLLDNSTLTNINISASQNGASVASGPSPVQFNLNLGQTYLLSAASPTTSYQFDHWQDNNTSSASRNVTISQDIAYTAYYRPINNILTVSTQLSNGTAINGATITLSQNGVTVSTGASPTNFSLVSGQQYTVTASNTGSFAFDHWQDNGLTNPSRSASITQNTAYVAIYKPVGKILTVNTQTANSQSITGATITLSQNGVTVGTAASSAQFNLISGQQYVVSASNMGQYIFKQWLDNGSTNATRVVSITQNTALTAVYYTPPVANSLSVTTNQATPVTVTLTGSDPDGRPLQYYVMTGPSLGAASIVNQTSHSVTYLPWNWLSGKDSFTFVVGDGIAFSQPATVNITIVPTVQKTTSDAVIITVDPRGHSVTGMFLTLTQNANVINSGYSHADFYVNNGQPYVVTDSPGPQNPFDHWQSNGSTNPSETISISQDTPIIVVHRTTSITLNPTKGSVSNSVTVNGTGFSSNSAITISYDGTSVPTNPGAATTSSAGAFATSFSVPSFSTGGLHTVKAADAGGFFNTATFNDTAAIPTYTLTVNAQTSTGTTIAGIFTSLSKNGQTVGTGFTPAQFSLQATIPYSVAVSNYNQYVFDHWADNASTNPVRPITITQNTTLTAIFKVPQISLNPTSGVSGTSVSVTGNYFIPNSAVTLTYDGAKLTTSPSAVTTSSTGAFNATFSVPTNSTGGSHTVSASAGAGSVASAPFTDTSAPVQRTLTVVSHMINTGATITGYYTSISSNGQTVGTGFTPVTFTINSGQQYTVAISSYGSVTFDHWADNGSTNPVRSISITANTTLDAIFR
jgi:hypothetical protein